MITILTCHIQIKKERYKIEPSLHDRERKRSYDGQAMTSTGSAENLTIMPWSRKEV